MSTATTPPPPPQHSTDGRWWWTGDQWIASEATATPVTAVDKAPSTSIPRDRGPGHASQRSWLRPSAIVSSVAVLVVVVAALVSASLPSRGHGAPVPFKQTAQVRGFDVTVVSVGCAPIGCNFVVGFTNVGTQPRQIHTSDVLMTDTDGRHYTAEPDGSDVLLIPYLTVQPGEVVEVVRLGGIGLGFYFNMSSAAVADHLTVMGKDFAVPPNGPTTGT